MKVAIMSDVHSNLEALEAVLEDARSQKVTHYVFLGDIVGYGPNPVECLGLVRSLDPSVVVMGNHDLFCTGVYMDMNAIAYEAVKWTMDRLDDDAKNWLRHLPMTVTKRDSIFVHSTLHRPQTFNYFMFGGRELHFVEQASMGKKVSFVGHSHRPEMSIYIEALGDIKMLDELLESGKQVKVNEGLCTAVNVGSVGQPRDHQWLATYVISEMNNWSPKTIELRRVKYDVMKTAKKVFDSDLPNHNGERLLTHYPASGQQ